MALAIARLTSGNVARVREDPVETTLLELVEVVGDVTDDEREVVATVLDLLRSGRVRLIGNFRGAMLTDA